MIHPGLEMQSPPNQLAYIYTTVHTHFVREKSAGSDFGPNFPVRLARENRRGRHAGRLARPARGDPGRHPGDGRGSPREEMRRQYR